MLLCGSQVGHASFDLRQGGVDLWTRVRGFEGSIAAREEVDSKSECMGGTVVVKFVVQDQSRSLVGLWTRRASVRRRHAMRLSTIKYYKTIQSRRGKSPEWAWRYANLGRSSEIRNHSGCHLNPFTAPTDASTTAIMMMSPRTMPQHIHLRVFRWETLAASRCATPPLTCSALFAT